MKKQIKPLSFFIGNALLLFSTQIGATCPTFSPYHMMTMNMSGGQPLDLTALSDTTGTKSYTLAFIIDAGGCTPAWDGVYKTSSAWGQSTTDKMRASKIAYNISFGGAAGNDISQSCSVNQLVNAYQQIINLYQPNGLDFDIENGTAKVGNVILALKSIQANNPNLKISFTLPVMPEGLVAEGKSIVTQAKTAGLNFSVNIMAMDYGISYTGNMGQYAIQAATSTFNYLKTLYTQSSNAEIWQKIQVTPMIGVNDVTSEIFTLANSDTLTAFANTNSIGGLSMWSLDRDKPCGGTTPNDSCSSGNVQTQNYEFTKHFQACATTQTCLPPANVQYKFNASKTAVTFTWSAPVNSLAVVNYQINDWMNRPIWQGPCTLYTDPSLPGTSGNFNYFLYSICANGQSVALPVTATA